MKKILFIFLFLVVCSNTFATNSNVDSNKSDKKNNFCIKNFKTVIKEKIDTVVEVKTFKLDNEKITRLNDDTINYTQSLVNNSVGSGFFISEDGYILTNNHVIDGADRIEVYSNGEKYRAELIGSDFYTDIALLKININNAKYIELENSVFYEVGDEVIAMGNPHGLGISVSKGIISGLNRSMENIEFFNLIQVDIGITKGNSGGPLLNCNGDIIGINTILYHNNNKNIGGVALAIPIDDVINIAKALKENGYVQRGWLGISGIDADKDLLKIVGSTRTSGVFVVNVDKVSSAYKSGVRPSDIIVSFDGKKLENNNQLIRMIRNTSVGDSVSLLILRNGKYIKFRVKVMDSPENSTYYTNINYINFMDMVAVEINDDVINKYKLYSKSKGLYIIDVKKGGFADYYNIEVGDTILFINQREINTKKDYELALSEIRKSKEFLMVINKKNKNNIVLKLNYNIIN